MQRLFESLQEDGWYRRYLAGNALRLQGRLQEALDEYEQCLEYDDVEEPRVLCTMASVMSEKKEHERALQIYRHVAQLDPQYPESYKGSGYTLLALGQYEEALQQYRKAEYLGAGDENAWIEMGNCLYHLNRVEEALEKYKKALHINPKNFAALHGEGLCFDSIGEHQISIKIFEEAIAENPVYPEAYLSMGVAFSHLGQHSKAIDAYLKVVELQPNSHEAYNNLGTSYEAVGSIQEALKAFTRATDLNPNYSQVYNNLAVLHRKKGDSSTALHCINKAVLLAPDEPMYYCNRAIILNKLGCEKQANEDVMKAAQLFRENKTKGLSYINISFIRETVELYAGVLQEIGTSVQSSVPKEEETDKLRTSVNNCLAKNLQQLLEAKAPSQSQISDMKNEIQELKFLVAQLIKDNAKMKAVIEDHESRLSNIEKYISEIVEPIRQKIYPSVQVERQLAQLKHESKDLYEYSVLLHRLINSYLQSIRLIASGLFQIKNPYESKFVEGLVTQVFKMAGGIPIVGGALEKIGSLISGVLQYRANVQFHQACAKAQHIIKSLRTEDELCYTILRAVVSLCQNTEKKAQILGCFKTLEQRRQQAGTVAKLASEVKCKVMKVIVSIDKKIQQKVFGLEQVPKFECPHLLLLATQDFLVFTEGMARIALEEETSIATIFEQVMIPTRQTKPSEIVLKPKKDIVVSYIYNIQRNQYLSLKGGELRFVSNPHNATKWSFKEVENTESDVYQILSSATKQCLSINSSEITTLKESDECDTKRHWRVIRDKRTQGSQFFVQSQQNLKLFLDGATKKRQRSWLFCSKTESESRSDIALSLWKSDDSLLWRFQRTKPNEI